MRHHIRLPRVVPHLAAAAMSAQRDPYGARGLLACAASGGPGPDRDVIVAGWVFSHDFRRTLLVDHPRFGWLSPGGRLEAGELPPDGALREVVEETGTDPRPLLPDPVAVLGNRESPERVYGLAYAFVTDPAAPLTPEAGQPASWFTIADMPPCPAFPLDHEALAATARALAGELRGASEVRSGSAAPLQGARSCDICGSAAWARPATTKPQTTEKTWTNGPCPAS